MKTFLASSDLKNQQYGDDTTFTDKTLFDN